MNAALRTAITLAGAASLSAGLSTHEPAAIRASGAGTPEQEARVRTRG